MTSRERVRKALSHQEPDMIPIDFGAMRSTGINAIAYNKLKGHLGIGEDPTRVYDVFQQLAEPGTGVLERMRGDVVQIHRLRTSFNIRNDKWKAWKLNDGSDCMVPLDFSPVQNSKGDLEILDGDSVIARMPKGGYYFDQVIHPYENAGSISDIDAIPLEEITDEELQFLRDQAGRLYKETEYALLGAFGGNIFEAGQMDWGYEKYFMQLALEPELMHYYHNRLAQNHLKNLRRYLDAIGEYLDVIQFGDDLGTQETSQISVEMYREMIKPYHKLQYEYVHKSNPSLKVFLHSCGSIYNLIPDLIDAGVDILNPVQLSAKNMDPVKLKNEFGKKLTFWGGGCNMQTTGTFGTLDEIEKEVGELTRIFAPGGGFVFTQIHNIQANISPEKVVRIYDTAAALREYPGFDGKN
ncbi:MAG: uroporphyrinogen decarboxylase family protein [Eubacteriales bacterium]|nr:uroporphyrinogen decarboxylase family protein [Eubacteriales bacterium]